MIMCGKHITSTGDKLVKVPIENLRDAIANPKDETKTLLRQLQVVRNIDYKKYNSSKKNLPYFVCGIFNPPFRHSDNFAYTEYFILDIDKLSEKEISPEELKKRIAEDSRVMLCFLSPSHDGLKILFKFSQRCTDKNIYQLFYKVFSKQFATQYNIEQVIDSKTCDVARACFASHDPEIYYNPNAELVVLDNFIPKDDPTAFFDLKREIEHQEKKEEQDQPKQPKTDVDSDIIKNIKEILYKKEVKTPEKNVIVPEQLNDMIGDLKQFILQTGIMVTNITNISYGKKIQMKAGRKEAEINVFYGKKKGFSVVISPRTGTDEELNEITSDLIRSFFIDY